MCYRESSDTPGLVLGPEWWREICIRGVETAGRGVVVKQAGEVAGSLLIKCFVGKEKDFELVVLLNYYKWRPLMFNQWMLLQ